MEFKKRHSSLNSFIHKTLQGEVFDLHLVRDNKSSFVIEHHGVGIGNGKVCGAKGAKGSDLFQSSRSLEKNDLRGRMQSQDKKWLQ